MQQLLQGLISTTESLTKARLSEQPELKEQMRQVELMEQQRAIVSRILEQYREKAPETPRQAIVKKIDTPFESTPRKNITPKKGTPARTCRREITKKIEKSEEKCKIAGWERL